MKQRLILLIISLFGYNATFAGTEDYKLTPTDSILEYSIFNKVKVIDIRANKDNFGYIKTGAFNATKTLQSSNPEKMFQDFAETLIRPAKEQQNATLLIVIQNFKITDRPVAGELGTFYVRASFYLSDADEQDKYQPILTVDSFFETVKGWDVTKAILKIANSKMTTWVSRIAYKFQKPQDYVFRSEKEIIDSLNAKANYPIYSEAPKEGIYMTEEDFLNNRPQEMPLLCTTDPTLANGLFKVYKKNEKGKFKIPIYNEEWFAVYSNGKWFKQTSFGVCKMTYSNNDFYFPEAGNGLRANDDMAVMFGIVGALVSNGSKSSAIYSMRYKPGTNSGQAVARLH
jgi:hypothetical protein